MQDIMTVQELITKCGRSLIHQLLSNHLEDMGNKYGTNVCEEKYLVKNYEHLSKLVQNIIKSGRGYYIIGYAHQKNINVCVTGINNKELLLDYAKWCYEEGEKALLRIQKETLELLEEENKMSLEDILNKNIEYLETEKKIIENIYDMEKKAPYCEKLITLITVHQSMLNFIETNLLIEPLRNELKRIGEI